MLTHKSFPPFADSTTGCYHGKQIIADFIKQNYPPEFPRADFPIPVAKKYDFCYDSFKR